MPALRGPTAPAHKTRRHTRDLDEIHADLSSPKHLEQWISTKAPEDLPGFGQWYCVECAKWYESERNFEVHKKAKPHRRRVRDLKDEPYSQREAERATGLGVDNCNAKGEVVGVEKVVEEADEMEVEMEGKQDVVK